MFNNCSQIVHILFTGKKFTKRVPAVCILQYGVYGFEVILISTAEKSQVRCEDKRYIEMAVEKYGKMLFRLCITLVKDYDDAEDAVQDTYIKYMTKAPQFRDSEHEKAWLIRVATNICKNMIRFRSRNSSLCLEDIGEIGVSETDSGILEAIMSLPAT